MPDPESIAFEGSSGQFFVHGGMRSTFPFYEFFSGGGMARLGLGDSWHCVFSNDFSEKKAEAYRHNFGPSPEFRKEDIWNLRSSDLPGSAMLSWGSFPCQDLSLAGNGQGLKGDRSSAFLPFWRLMTDLTTEGRGVPMVVLENVVGTLTSNGGHDFVAILESMVRTGYSPGAIVVDAIHFVPQSRPRLFIVGIKSDCALTSQYSHGEPSPVYHPKRLIDCYKQLPDDIRNRWVWWRLPPPDAPRKSLADIVEQEPSGVKWHTQAETEKLIGMMSETNLAKLRRARLYRKKIVGTVYKRVRSDGKGGKLQRAEVRFDQISGCLRTPSGGSSRQVILCVEGDQIKSRLISTREAARLMGLPDQYRLPHNYNDAYHIVGDGLVVPVVSWLEQHLLRPLAMQCSAIETKIA